MEGLLDPAAIDCQGTENAGLTAHGTPAFTAVPAPTLLPVGYHLACPLPPQFRQDAASLNAAGCGGWRAATG